MTAPDAAALVGQTIASAFRLDALIGRGGFGAVYRAVDTRIGRTVALKVALKGHDPQMARRFRREARAQVDLRHRCIVRLLEYGVHAGMPYIVLEYVEGVTLRAVVDAEGPLATGRASALFADLLDALDEAHAGGVVHRDIKPENIMLVQGRRGEEVRLLDFGIAKLIEPEAGSATLTPHDAVIGSVSWLAPEQAGTGEITARTDIYSVGCVLFWALTGRKPFDGTARQVILAHVAQPPPPLPAYVPPMLADAIRRAMQKDPAARFQSAEAMAHAMRGQELTAHDGVGFLDPADVHTYESGLSRREPVPRSRRTAGLAVTALLLLAGTLLAAQWIELAPSDSRPEAGVTPPNTSPPTGIGDLPDGPALPVEDARVHDGAPQPGPDSQPPPSTRAFDRAVARCDCVTARRENATLARRGADRQSALERRCGDGRGRQLGSCGDGLKRRIEKALTSCPCHEDPTGSDVRRLHDDFGLDLTRAWRQRCVLPLPGSCTWKGE